jgi:ornithine carbamoyltransferase
MARLFEHDHIIELAENSTVPVINALTDWSHPCQILSDLLTIREHFGKTKGLTLAYVGDCNNNVTHSLMQGCPLAGINVKVGGPSSQPLPMPDSSDEGMKAAIEASSGTGSYLPHPTATEIALKLAKANNTKVEIFTDPVEAVMDADIVYADSWMSYGIPDKEREERFTALAPFQVTSELMSHAKPKAIFMNCLPAMRGEEQTAEVIDGPQSIVFDQAENRLHCQKAIILKLLDLA